MFFRTAVASLVVAAVHSAAQGVGSGTFFNPGLGACGIQNSDADAIIAVSAALYDSTAIDGNPNHNTICGRPVAISFQGRTVQATVTDRCVACAGNDIDMSPAVFNQLADPSVGRITVSWNFI